MTLTLPPLEPPMRHLLLLTALILPTLTACSMGHCEVDGVHYEVGETWACADGGSFANV